MKYFTHSIRIMGTAQEFDPEQLRFKLKCQSGDTFDVNVGEGTGYYFIRNFDGLNRDRTPTREGYDYNNPRDQLKRYIRDDILVSAYGIYQEHEENTRFDAKEIWLFHNINNEYLFEETHWWRTQITALADRWLFNQLGPSNMYDFSNYQTNLSFVGGKVGNTIQECATLSRLIYGLSSAYLMSGNERYYQAARHGIEYQRNMFRTESHDGSFVVWSHAYDKENVKKILPSQFDDDKDAIPLYEQIYALAGLTQFYRISNDWETLDDIQRTIHFFNERFLDNEQMGYFSHIDCATFKPDSAVLGDNCSKKNWNSIGDHTPAYLLNLLLAIENIPNNELSTLSKQCKKMQKQMADLITEKFPDPDASIPYVRERFYRDWKPDLTYKWQQNRAVVGHNLKIAWNLTRTFNYLDDRSYLDLAVKIGHLMKTYGLDQIRGGWFDVVEREPKNGMPMDFTWHNRKAWWQQEQAILAYLILYGSTADESFLQLARESIAFWNMTYLELSYDGVHFDVTDDGLSYIKDDRAMKGSHSKSGYHVFELNYLADLYMRTFVTKEPFRRYYKPCPTRKSNIFNVMLDYLPKDSLRMGKVYVNGEEWNAVDRDSCQIQLQNSQKDASVAVEFVPNKDYQPQEVAQ